MSRRAALFLVCALTATSAASRARAAETVCWFENGAVVVPAEIAGVAGDWLLDPSQPRTLLHETRAQMEGLPATFVADGQVAGRRLRDVQVTVADLDDRAPGFTTPIAGVLGADVLERFVVDLDFAPCRVRFSAGRAPAFGRARTLAVHDVDGVPVIEAAIADDHAARRGVFAIDWSAKAAVRVRDGAVRPAVAGLDPTLVNRAPARLRALSLDGDLYEEQSAALAPALPPDLAGALGTDFWSRWRIRLDLAHGRLLLAPGKRP